MTAYITFILGIFFGMVVIGLLGSGKTEDLYREIYILRDQLGKLKKQVKNA